MDHSLSSADNRMSLRPVVCIVQARMSSTRLPGKVLKEICGEPMLKLLIDRLRMSETIDKLVIATSVDISDDIIEDKCEEWGVDCFRGSLEDVLDRYYQAALKYEAGTVVRITADCPLIDPKIVDLVVGRFLEGGYDRAGTEKSYPNGLDTEVLGFWALETAWKEACLASEREHVSTYIRFNPEDFKLLPIECYEDFSHMRWTVDEEADFQLVTKIFEGLLPGGKFFGMKEILAFLEENPELLEINAHLKRDAGLKKSLSEDKNLPPRGF